MKPITRQTAERKLRNFSIDDLHLVACCEFDQDPDALTLLNSLYGSYQAEMIETLLDLREIQERAA